VQRYSIKIKFGTLKWDKLITLDESIVQDEPRAENIAWDERIGRMRYITAVKL
jgi:hypothetical protein